jgi:hypothetical protein
MEVLILNSHSDIYVNHIRSGISRMNGGAVMVMLTEIVGNLMIDYSYHKNGNRRYMLIHSYGVKRI